MRVLVVHNRYRPAAPSGENRVVDQEAAALADHGQDVEVFQRHSEEIASWSRLRRATLPARILWSADSRRAVANELARFAPDVVHVHNTFPLLSPSILYACRDARVPVVLTVHNYKLACASGELFRAGAVCHECLGGSPLPALVHGCYRGSRVATIPVIAGATLHAAGWRTLLSAYVFVSAAQQRLLEPAGLPAERCFVKHNFVPTPPVVDVPAEHAVAFVGRLDVAKGARVLMGAWDEFRARRPRSSLRLVIAGAGPLEPEVATWAADHASVTPAGHVTREEAMSILGRARAALVPSQWEETFGMVAIEAMAAGTAPIVSAHGALPELVTEGRDGALVAPGDTTALVDAIVDVDDSPERWERYGRQARMTYARRFGPQANVERLLGIYRFAIEHPVGRSGADTGIAGPSGSSPSGGTRRGS